MKFSTVTRWLVGASFAAAGVYGAVAPASASPADNTCSSSFTPTGSPVTAYTGGPITVAVDCASGTGYGPAGANYAPPQQVAGTWYDPNDNEFDAYINAGPQPFGAPDGTGSIAWTSTGFTSSQSYASDPFGNCSTGSPCDLTAVKWSNGGSDGGVSYARWNPDGSMLYSAGVNSNGTWDAPTAPPSSGGSGSGISGAFDTARTQLIGYVTTGVTSVATILLIGVGVAVLVKYTRKSARAA